MVKGAGLDEENRAEAVKRRKPLEKFEKKKGKS